MPLTRQNQISEKKPWLCVLRNGQLAVSPHGSSHVALLRIGPQSTVEDFHLPGLTRKNSGFLLSVGRLFRSCPCLSLGDWRPPTAFPQSPVISLANQWLHGLFSLTSWNLSFYSASFTFVCVEYSRAGHMHNPPEKGVTVTVSFLT